MTEITKRTYSVEAYSGETRTGVFIFSESYYDAFRFYWDFEPDNPKTTHCCLIEWNPSQGQIWSHGRNELRKKVFVPKYYICINKDDDIVDYSVGLKTPLFIGHPNCKTLECEKDIYDLLESHGYLPNPIDEHIWQYDAARKIAYLPRVKRRENVWSQLDRLEQTGQTDQTGRPEQVDQTNEEICNYCGQNYSDHSEKLCSGT